MLAPKGYTQHISKEAYIAARTIASSKNGVLRYRMPLVCLAAAMLLGGAKTVYQGGNIGYYMTGIILMLLGAVCALMALYVLPKQVGIAAERDYVTFSVLSDPANVTFESDDMCFQTDKLTRRVEYAKTRLCIETRARFVVLTDDGAMVILEKDCFEDNDATLAFLRDVFARWYKRG